MSVINQLSDESEYQVVEHFFGIGNIISAVTGLVNALVQIVKLIPELLSLIPQLIALIPQVIKMIPMLIKLLVFIIRTLPDFIISVVNHIRSFFTNIWSVKYAAVALLLASFTGVKIFFDNLFETTDVIPPMELGILSLVILFFGVSQYHGIMREIQNGVFWALGKIFGWEFLKDLYDFPDLSKARSFDKVSLVGRWIGKYLFLIVLTTIVVLLTLKFIVTKSFDMIEELASGE